MAESEHYGPLFPDCEVIGLDYRTFNPWEIGKEIYNAVTELKDKYEKVILIANSIGAFFSMIAGIGDMIEKACFISPPAAPRKSFFSETSLSFTFSYNTPISTKSCL